MDCGDSGTAATLPVVLRITAKPAASRPLAADMQTAARGTSNQGIPGCFIFAHIVQSMLRRK
jgi:hypothetical protein